MKRFIIVLLLFIAVSVPSRGRPALTSVITNQPISVATGTQVFGPATIPNGISQITLSLARDTTSTPTLWPNASTTLDMLVEVSSDGGVTWESSGEFTAIGGIITAHGGTELAATTFSDSFPSKTSSTHIRATATVTGGPLVSLLSLSVQ